MVSVVGFCLWFPSSQETLFVWFPSLVFVAMVSVVAGKCLFMVSVAGFLVDPAAAGGSQILERIERFLVCCVFRTGFRRWFVDGFRYVFVMVSVTLFMASIA